VDADVVVLQGVVVGDGVVVRTVEVDADVVVLHGVA